MPLRDRADDVPRSSTQQHNQAVEIETGINKRMISLRCAVQDSQIVYNNFLVYIQCWLSCTILPRFARMSQETCRTRTRSHDAKATPLTRALVNWSCTAHVARNPVARTYDKSRTRFMRGFDGAMSSGSNSCVSVDRRVSAVTSQHLFAVQSCQSIVSKISYNT